LKDSMPPPASATTQSVKVPPMSMLTVYDIAAVPRR
jgi:hypothetical protein